MLKKTKAAVKAELTKSIVDVTVCSDPAPMSVSGGAKVLKALKEDLVHIFTKTGKRDEG